MPSTSYIGAVFLISSTPSDSGGPGSSHPRFFLVRKSLEVPARRVPQPWIGNLLHRYAARGGQLCPGLPGFGEHRFLAREVRNPVHSHIAVRRADFDSVPHTVQDRSCGARREIDHVPSA